MIHITLILVWILVLMQSILITKLSRRNTELRRKLEQSQIERLTLLGHDD